MFSNLCMPHLCMFPWAIWISEVSQRSSRFLLESCKTNLELPGFLFCFSLHVPNQHQTVSTCLILLDHAQLCLKPWYNGCNISYPASFFFSRTSASSFLWMCYKLSPHIVGELMVFRDLVIALMDFFVLSLPSTKTVGYSSCLAGCPHREIAWKPNNKDAVEENWDSDSWIKMKLSSKTSPVPKSEVLYSLFFLMCWIAFLLKNSYLKNTAVW